MQTVAKEAKPRAGAQDAEMFDPADWLPAEIGKISDQQTDLPRIAKDAKAVAAIESRLSQIPTSHDLHNCDARQIDFRLIAQSYG